MQEFIKKHKMGIFITVSAIIMVIGLSYAWLQLTLRGSKELSILTSGKLELVLDDSMTEGISVTNSVPVTDDMGLEQKAYTFTLENKGTIDSDYTIYLDDLELTEDQTRMKDSFIKYELVKNGERVNLDLLSTTGEHPNRVLDKDVISAKDKYTYSLKIWIDSNATNEVMNTTFKGQLRIEAIQGKTKDLYKIIAKKAVLDNAKSEFVTNETGIDFGQISSDTNGKGVYTFASTKDDAFPVHYYRGAVTDNNVKFAGLCWKIVRTTETGGVKLIYNGLPDENGYCTNTTGEATEIKNSAFNITDYGKQYIGYMINNTSDSTVKGVIDTWYQTNMTSYTDRLEDTIWCNDRSLTKTEGRITYFGPNNRTYTIHTPSLGCVNDADKFTVNAKNGNGLLTYPVALLTADEVVLAGGIWDTLNSNYYLYTNRQWWSLSPSIFDSYSAYNLVIKSNGALYSGRIDHSADSSGNVRPSVSLASNTKIRSGDGSMEKPYEIK